MIADHRSPTLALTTHAHRRVTLITAVVYLLGYCAMNEVSRAPAVERYDVVPLSPAGYRECSMSTLANSDPQLPKFTRRSDAESICNSCFVTLRADRYMPIEVAEEIHADVCLLRPDSPVEYVLW